MPTREREMYHMQNEYNHIHRVHEVGNYLEKPTDKQTTKFLHLKTFYTEMQSKNRRAQIERKKEKRDRQQKKQQQNGSK